MQYSNNIGIFDNFRIMTFVLADLYNIYKNLIAILSIVIRTGSKKVVLDVSLGDIHKRHFIGSV